jgi:penicillin-binding protein 2
LPSHEWKQRVLGEQWYDGETLSVAIGQGYVAVTPMQLSAYVNTLANGGLWVRPTLIRRITAPDGRLLASEQDLPRDSRLLPLAPEIFDVIKHGMVEAVNGDQATARRAQSRLFTVAGKTGTSQVVGRKAAKKSGEEEKDDDLLPHSLFIGYAPAEDPKVSVTVLVEHGQAGGRTAAPIARQVLEFYDKHVESLEARPPGVQMAGAVPDENFRRKLQGAFDGSPDELQMPPPPSAPPLGAN